MRQLLLSFAVLGLLGILPAWADRVAPSDKPIRVRLELYKPTSIQFPELILNINALELPDQYTANPVGVYLYLTAKVPEVESRLFVLGQYGDQYQVDFNVGTPSDVVVRVARPQVQTAAQGKTQPFSLASWFRALRLGQPIPGQRAADMPPPHLPDARLSILSSGAVSRGAMIGLVLHVQNTTEGVLTFDDRLNEPRQAVRDDVVSLGQWGWPPKVSVEAVALEDKRLQPGQTTRVYVLFEKR
jgi:hypothetical protein